MKRIFALIFALVMVLSLAGCGAESGEVKYAEAPEVVIPEKGKITDNVYENAQA